MSERERDSSKKLMLGGFQHWLELMFTLANEAFSFRHEIRERERNEIIKKELLADGREKEIGSCWSLAFVTFHRIEKNGRFCDIFLLMFLSGRSSLNKFRFYAAIVVVVVGSHVHFILSSLSLTAVCFYKPLIEPLISSVLFAFQRFPQ